MEGVTVVDHPMVQHKLTLMRDKERSTKGFRQLLNEIGRLLCYEVTRDLPLETGRDRDAARADEGAAASPARSSSSRRSCAPATGFLEGMLDLVPSARVAHIGIYRDPETLKAVEYYFKAPPDVAERLVICSIRCWRPANSAVAAVERMKERGAKRHPLRLPARRAGGHSPG